MERIKVRFKTNVEDYENDYLDIVRAFYPHIELSDDEDAKLIELNLYEGEDLRFCTKIDLDINCLEHYENRFNLEVNNPLLVINSLKKRHSKAFLYKVLSDKLQVNLPYGSLTGIRPTKLYHDLDGKIDVDKYFKETLYCSDEKLNLIKLICKNQEGIYLKDESTVDVFVNIPICVTRCSYCSFLSAELRYVKSLICPYTNQVLEEIELTKQIIKDKKLTVKSVYIGGGTPTSIDEENFEKIALAANFEAFGAKEYTIEAGRPDTISKSKLDIMKKAHVTRISINPQSFNQKTLDLIGRSHSIQEVYDVYRMAREYPFDINMDLIAMLPGESLEDFKYSVDEAIKLNPENITIHTLALKRGSKLHEENYDNASINLPSLMVDYAREAVMKAGYMPYYMYKQKHVSGNLENVGYCKEGKACIYNVDIMEETTSIIANGAGAISKRIFIDENRLERLPEAKGIQVYLERKEDILSKKRAFFS